VSVVAVERSAVQRRKDDGGADARNAADAAAREIRPVSAPAETDPWKRQIRERRERNERFDAQRYSANQWNRPYFQAEKLETVQDRVRTTPFRYSILRSEAERFPEQGQGTAQ